MSSTQAPSINEVHDALRKLLSYKPDPALNYAVNYAEHGLVCNTPHALKVQCMYVLNNITHWRRQPVARQVRETLKNYVAHTEDD